MSHWTLIDPGHWTNAIWLAGIRRGAENLRAGLYDDTAEEQRRRVDRHSRSHYDRDFSGIMYRRQYVARSQS